MQILEWHVAVRDTVWKQAGFRPADLYCIGCLEKQLQRELTASDFWCGDDDGYRTVDDIRREYGSNAHSLSARAKERLGLTASI